MRQCGCWNDTPLFRAATWEANPSKTVIEMGQVIVIPVSFVFCHVEQDLSPSSSGAPVSPPDELHLLVEQILDCLNKSTACSATPILFFASTTHTTHLGFPIRSNDPATITTVIQQHLPPGNPETLTICVIESISDLFGYARSPWDAKQLLALDPPGNLGPGIVLCNVHIDSKSPSRGLGGSSSIRVEVLHLLHQLGHWFGLEHSTDPSDLMCDPAIWKGELEFHDQQLDIVRDTVIQFKPFLIHAHVPVQYQSQGDPKQTNRLIASYDFRSNWGWAGEMKLLGNGFLSSNARIISDHPYQGTHSLRVKTNGIGELSICLERYRDVTLKVMYYSPELGATIMVRPSGYCNPETGDWYMVHLERNTMYDEVAILLPEPYRNGYDGEKESIYTIRFAYQGHGKQCAYFDCIQVRGRLQ